MIRFALLAGATLMMTACATTSKRRVVQVNERAPIMASTVNYSSLEASAACDTRKMRRRALDDDPMNDIASITVQRELSPGRRTETDLDVNCRDYFARQLRGQPGGEPRTIRAATQSRVLTEPTVIVSRTSTAQAEPAPIIEVRRATPARRILRVRRGDTLYGIARAHCTGWKTLAQENGLSNAHRISPGDVLYLPAGAC